MWALDPWSEAPRFLPVPDDGRLAYRVPESEAMPILWGHYRNTWSPDYVDTYRREFRSPALGRDFAVYVAARDERRLLVDLRAAERVVLLFSLIGGSR